MLYCLFNDVYDSSEFTSCLFCSCFTQFEKTMNSLSNLSSALTLLMLLSRHICFCEQNCSSLIVVNDTVGMNCMYGGAESSNKTCNSLQDVLSHLSSISGPADNNSIICISIKPGEHAITQVTNINHNVVLTGVDDNVTVVFKLTEYPMAPEPVYALSFRNTRYVEISGVSFYGDVNIGLIGFDNITDVFIKKSFFRYDECI